MKRDGGPVFPAHAKTGHPHGPFRGLPANENARALISMVAQSTCSNQRPDTLMQDRRADRSTKPSCDDFVSTRCRPLAKHDGSLRIHDHHAAKHLRCNVRVLERDQPAFTLTAQPLCLRHHRRAASRTRRLRHSLQRNLARRSARLSYPSPGASRSMPT